MSAALQDFRYGARLLWKSPGFAAVVLLTLALGIGANTAIFSVVEEVLIRPLPCPHPERLVLVWEKDPAQNRFQTYVTPADFLDWQAQNRVFERLAALRDVQVNLAAHGGEPEEVAAQRVSASLFPLMGMRPIAGRPFSAAEDSPSAGCVAVLGQALWQRRFGSDRALIGRGIRVNSESCTVIGVMPAGFQVHNRAAELWLPLALSDAVKSRASGSRDLVIIGRLRSGVTLRQAAAQMDTLSRRLEQVYPAFNAGWSADLSPLREELVGKVRPALLVLMGAVGLLLLIACSNVANLLLARAAERQREIAIRAALGASCGRLVRQLLSESAALSLAGGAAGLLLARWVLRVLAALAPRDLAPIAAIGLDSVLLAFAVGLSLLTGILCGIAPALALARPNLAAGLKEGGRGLAGGRGRRYLRSALVMCEIALSVVLLVSAGLMLESLARLGRVDPGFDPHRALTARVRLSGGRNAALDRRAGFFGEALQRIRALPGVRAAGAVDVLPLAGFGRGVAFSIPGRPVLPAAQHPVALFRYVDPDYFRAAGIPLRSGRYFNAHDTPEAAPVIAISQTMARRFWPAGDALGARVALETRPPGSVEVVAVVGDVKADALTSEAWPMIYRPHAQMPAATMTLVVRTAGEPAALAPAVAREIAALDPDQPVSEVRTLQQLLDGAGAQARFQTTLLAAFGVLSLVLAAVGLYGVMACAVAERRREIGIRMALGANRPAIFRLVLGQAALLALAGTALGLALAAALTRLMASLLFGIMPTDSLVFAAISGLLVSAAAAASLLPARAATSLDPAAALRLE